MPFATLRKTARSPALFRLGAPGRDGGEIGCDSTIRIFIVDVSSDAPETRAPPNRRIFCAFLAPCSAKCGGDAVAAARAVERISEVPVNRSMRPADLAVIRDPCPSFALTPGSNSPPNRLMANPINIAGNGPQDPAALWRSGAAALRSGDAVTAKATFERIIAQGASDPAVWFGLALARRATGDGQGAMAAADEVLSRDPVNIRALILKADQYLAFGQRIAASSHYRAAAGLAKKAGEDLAPDLVKEGERALLAASALEGQYEAYLRQRMTEHGVDGPGGERVAASLDLMVGKRRIYLQEPTQHYFPGLPQIEFYARQETPWLAEVEAWTPQIRDELVALLEHERLFKPYVEREPDRPFFDRFGLLDNPDWSAFYLWKNGAPVEENVARCPKTMESLAMAPICDIPGRTPSILFSLLRPGARIPPHHGLLNSRLICHLPLIVPPGCGFRVGSETRAWEEGRAFAFDDSIEHEAWNLGDRVRVVLIFDVWRPELTLKERALMRGILEAVDEFGKTAPGQEPTRG